MQDADLFMELAGIAGVFVGFGALIAVRSGGASEPAEISPVRVAVAMGMLAVIGALAPVTLSRYSLTDHQVLALSSVLVLVGTFGTFVVYIRSPEYQAVSAARGGRELSASGVVENVVWLALVGMMALAPVAIVLGVVRSHEAALYFTLVALLLFWAAIGLLMLVFTGRRRVPA
jgi:hypothetical protein